MAGQQHAQSIAQQNSELACENSQLKARISEIGQNLNQLSQQNLQLRSMGHCNNWLNDNLNKLEANVLLKFNEIVKLFDDIRVQNNLPMGKLHNFFSESNLRWNDDTKKNNIVIHNKKQTVRNCKTKRYGKSARRMSTLITNSNLSSNDNNTDEKSIKENNGERIPESIKQDNLENEVTEWKTQSKPNNIGLDLKKRTSSRRNTTSDIKTTEKPPAQEPTPRGSISPELPSQESTPQESDSRRTRRTRGKNVNYKLPSLRAKMRRPTKKFVDATTVTNINDLQVTKESSLNKGTRLNHSIKTESMVDNSGHELNNDTFTTTLNSISEINDLTAISSSGTVNDKSKQSIKTETDIPNSEKDKMQLPKREKRLPKRESANNSTNSMTQIENESNIKEELEYEPAVSKRKRESELESCNDPSNVKSLLKSKRLRKNSIIDDKITNIKSNKVDVNANMEENYDPLFFVEEKTTNKYSKMFKSKIKGSIFNDINEVKNMKVRPQRHDKKVLNDVTNKMNKSTTTSRRKLLKTAIINDLYNDAEDLDFYDEYSRNNSENNKVLASSNSTSLSSSPLPLSASSTSSHRENISSFRFHDDDLSVFNIFSMRKR